MAENLIIIKSENASLSKLAKNVMIRFQKYKDYRKNHKLDGNVGAEEWADRAHRMYNKIHEATEKELFPEMRGYFGIARLKVDGTNATINDLVAPVIQTPFHITPTPIPSLSKEGKDIVAAKVKQQLSEKLQESGLSPYDILGENQAIDPRAMTWIAELTKNLRMTQVNVESNFSAAGSRLEAVMLSDWFKQSNWRQQFTDAIRDGLIYPGMYVKGPFMELGVTNKWEGNQFKSVKELIPSFKNINWYDAYPAPDARGANDGEGFFELSRISRQNLIGLFSDERYQHSEIAKVLEERNANNLDWTAEIGNIFNSNRSNIKPWADNASIDCLIYQGKFSGGELAEAGVTGFSKREQVDIEIEIVGGRIMRCDKIKTPGGIRNVQSASYRPGAGPFGSSICTILYDSQIRLNRLYMDIAKATHQQAGAFYGVNAEAWDDPTETGMLKAFGMAMLNGRAENTNRAISMYQPQPTYTQLWNHFLQEVKVCDEITGVSVLNYAAPQSSPALQTATGMSILFANAQKQLKNYLYQIDTNCIDPMMKTAHRMIVSMEKSLRWAADANIASAGLSSLLQRDIQQARVAENLQVLVSGVGAGIVPKEIAISAYRQFAENLGLNVQDEFPGNETSLEIRDALAGQVSATQIPIAANAPIPEGVLVGGLSQGQQAPALS